MWYRAEFKDDNFEMILADNDNEAYETAKEMEEELLLKNVAFRVEKIGLRS